METTYTEGKIKEKTQGEFEPTNQGLPVPSVNTAVAAASTTAEGVGLSPALSSWWPSNLMLVPPVVHSNQQLQGRDQQGSL